MHQILESLKEFVKTCQHHPLGTLLALLLLTMIAIGWTVSSNIEIILDHIPRGTQRERFEQSLNAQELVETELEALRKDTAADRALVFRFHLTANDASSQPLTIISITNTAMAPGVSIDARLLQPFPVAAVRPLIRELWPERERPRCVSRNIEDITVPLLRARLEARGAHVVLTCPLTDRAGIPSGILSIEYLRKEATRPSDTDLIRMMQTSAERIESYVLMPPVTPQQRRLW